MVCAIDQPRIDSDPEHATSARIFNAIAAERQGLRDGTHQLLGAQRKDLARRLTTSRDRSMQIDAHRERLTEIAVDRLRVSATGVRSSRSIARQSGG